MPSPFTRRQALENQAFLDLLGERGNIRAAARALGVAPSTLHHRRAAHPAFAQAWDAAVAFADARLAAEGGRRGPAGHGSRARSTHRTQGGEPVVVRRRDGRLQMRAAQPGKLTRQCEQAFLTALSATANIRLSAAAAGASVAAFYRRRRKDAGFAREMRLALQTGYERLEMALHAAGLADAHAHDQWRHNDPPAIPPMTADQALQLLYLHQKEARLLAEPAHIKRRRGESKEAWSYRLSAMYELRLERDREAYEIAEAARRDAEDRETSEPPAPPLPDLSQVSGWSKASGRSPHREGRALFGGWRIAEMKRKNRIVKKPT